MSSFGTPAVKRHHINVKGISPPSKRSSIGTNKGRSNDTVRMRRASTDQGGSQFAQTVLIQLERLSTLKQTPPLLENATVGEFIIIKPLFKNYKAQISYKDLAELISPKAKNFLCVLYNKFLHEFISPMIYL